MLSEVAFGMSDFSIIGTIVEKRQRSAWTMKLERNKNCINMLKIINYYGFLSMKANKNRAEITINLYFLNDRA